MSAIAATARGTTGARRSTNWVVALAGIGSLMAALDTLVVANALNTIHAALHASVAQLEWTVNAYNLAFAVLLIPASTLGDRFGRRRLFAAGLALFAIASAGCAVAPGIGVLIVFRAIQGAAAALITPLGLALLAAAFPPERRGAAIGLFSAVTGIAVALGPLIGGAIVSGISWQWIFWVNVPIGLVAAVLAIRRMDESFGPRRAFDSRGVALVTTAVFGIVWGLVRANRVGWGSAEVLISLVDGVALAVAFVAWELRTAEPMLPVALFGDRSFAAGNIAVASTAASLWGAVFFFPQLLQVVLHDGPLTAGLALMPWTATFITIAPGAGALADRIGSRPLLVVGLTMQALGMAWIALIASTDVSYAQLIGPFVLAGAGTSLAFPAGQTAALSSAPAEMIGPASGANSMTRQLGGVVGVAVAVAVFSATGGYASPHAFVDGFGAAAAAGAGFSVIGALAGAALPRRATRALRVAEATR